MSELADALKKQLEANSESDNKQQEFGDKKDVKTSDKSTQEPVAHYTAEELEKMAKNASESTFDELDTNKMEEQLKSKYDSLNKMAQKRQQFIAEKERKLDELINKFNDTWQILEKQKAMYEETIGEMSEEEKQENEKLAKMKAELDKHQMQLNYMNAYAEVKKMIPDYGYFSEQEMANTIENEYPEILPLLAVENGKYASIVMGAAHTLTLLKKENFQRYLADYLMNSLDDSNIEKTLIKAVKILAQKRKEKPAQLSKKEDQKEVVEKQIENEKTKKSKTLKDIFLNEVQNLKKQIEQ